MAGDHPTDELGRMLPHPWWPADRQAPGELEFVRRFCNSINRENGAERFTTPADLDRWLASEGAPPVHTSRAGLQQLIDVREALHRLVVANTTGADDPPAWSSLVRASRHVTFRAARSPTGIELQARGNALDMLIGRLLAAVVAATDDATWPRLKACSTCEWVVFDPSKNRSARWCSMRACGGRHNAREYRRRKSSA